jgi:hypothetical protein
LTGDELAERRDSDFSARTVYLDWRQQALEDHALAAREHTVAVNISLGYYSNPNVKALRHRIPRYWLPTRARW